MIKKNMLKFLCFSMFSLLFLTNNIKVNAFEIVTTSNIEEKTSYYNTNIVSFNTKTNDIVIGVGYNQNDLLDKKETIEIENIENLGVNISEDIIYIYEKPDLKSKKLAVLPVNGVCDILTNKELLNIDKFLKNEEHFILIKSGEFEGYVLSKNIATEDLDKYLTISTYGQILDKADCKLVPDNNSKTQDIIEKNTIIQVLDYSADNKWVKTMYNDNYYYIKSSLLNIKTFVDYAYKYEKNSSYMSANTNYKTYEEFQENIVEFALQFVGNKYVWGGTSLTNGADCSGFVQAIYRNFDIYIDRCASSQSDDGKRISTNELLPGDLVFYSDGTGISHVAMYIGEGQIVHASNSKPYPKGGIKISDVFYNTPYCCVRIFDENK